jgi:hypothetical protein
VIFSLAPPCRNPSALNLHSSSNFSVLPLFLSSCRLVYFSARYESLWNCMLPKLLPSNRILKPLRPAFWRAPQCESCYEDLLPLHLNTTVFRHIWQQPKSTATPRNT